MINTFVKQTNKQTMNNEEIFAAVARFNKAKRIFLAPHRKGINYLNLMDIMRECKEIIELNQYI